jgi:hypothetical protein
MAFKFFTDDKLMERPPHDLSRCIVTFEPKSTLIAVVEMSLDSGLYRLDSGLYRLDVQRTNLAGFVI